MLLHFFSAVIHTEALFLPFVFQMLTTPFHLGLLHLLSCHSRWPVLNFEAVIGVWSLKHCILQTLFPVEHCAMSHFANYILIIVTPIYPTLHYCSIFIYCLFSFSLWSLMQFSHYLTRDQGIYTSLPQVHSTHCAIIVLLFIIIPVP